MTCCWHVFAVAMAALSYSQFSFIRILNAADQDYNVQFREIDQPIASSYCGMYALAGALTAIGKEYDPEVLFSGEFIPGRSGSSMSDIVSAGKRFGAECMPIRNLSLGALRGLKCPAILHLNRSLASLNTYHWVLYLGEHDGKARIVDAPDATELVEYTTLLAEWDNVAVLVSSTRQPQMAIPGVSSVLTLALCFTSLVLVNQFWQSRGVRTTGLRSFVARGISILILVAIGSLFVGYYGEARILSDRPAAGIVKARHMRDNIPEVMPDEFQSILNRSDVQFVDARTPSAFSRGSIPGAINIPINSSNRQFKDQICKLSDSNETIVFCQGESCAWAGIVGKRLAASGFRSVKVFEPGVEGYLQHRKQPMVKPQ